MSNIVFVILIGCFAILWITIFSIFVYKAVSGKALKAYQKPKKHYDNYTRGIIVKTSPVYQKTNKYMIIQYNVNGVSYFVRITGFTTPKVYQLMDELLGVRKSTLLTQWVISETIGKEVFVYYNDNDPQDCFVSPTLLSE